MGKWSPEDAKEVEKRIGSICHGTKVEASFEEDYDLGGLLARGTFSSVREATRKADGVKAAVMVVKRSTLDEIGLGCLRREACLLRELEHPNVVKLYGLYEEKTTLYMSLELCQGGDLLDFIASKNSYNEKDARGLVRTLLTTVKHMHDNNIVHCDLQPKNLLLVTKCDIANLKIAGFRFATKENTASDNCPKSHSSPEYLAPEIWNSKPCGSSVDMWSVGVLTYILVAGYSPFQAGDQVEMVRRIRKGVFRFKKEHWAPPISREIEELIRRMLTVNPANRISTEDALNHPWLREGDALLAKKNLKATLPRLRAFNAKRKLRAVFFAASAATILWSDCSQAILGAEGHKGHVFHTFVSETPIGEQDLHGGTLLCQQFPPFDCMPTEKDDCEPGDKLEGVQLRQYDIGTAKPDPQLTLRKTLATNLVASECYESADDGIRLAVQENSLADQRKAGPIELEETARIVSCDGQDYFIGRIVHCKPSGISFPEPLLLDFYIQGEEGEEGEEGQPSLDEILQTYQVLHRDGDGEWHTVPKQQLSSFQDRGSRTTFLRTQVDHFSGYANGRKVHENDRYTYGQQRDSRAVIIKNGTSRSEKTPKCTALFARKEAPGRSSAKSENKDREVGGTDGGPEQNAERGATLLVVSVPIELESRRDTEHGYQAGLGFAGMSTDLGTTARVRTEKYPVPGATRPFCQSLLDGGTCKIVVGAPKQNMRVLVCTLEECAGLCGGRDEQSMTLWDDIQVYGGQEIGILPKFFEGMRLKSTNINKEDPCNALADVAMELAGFSLEAGAGPSHGGHSGLRSAVKSAIRYWSKGK